MFRFAQHDNYGRLSLFLIGRPCARGRLALKARPPQPARASTRMSARTEMIQCKDSIVILRRSEDRRRICNLSPNRFLTALRLSFSSLLGRVRKRFLRSLRSSIRFAQNDKVSLSGIRAQPAGHACGPPPAKAAARTAQGAARCNDIRTETIVPHPPPHSFERLLHNACCRQPPP